MARRNYREQVAPDLEPSGVQPVTGLAVHVRDPREARVLDTVAAQIDRFVSGELSRDARIAAQEGAAAGEQAASADPAARLPGETIRAAAFNRAAQETALRQVELGARTRLAELDRLYGDDPPALERQAQSYRDGVATALPHDIAQAYRSSFDALLQPQLARAFRTADARVAQERGASFDALMQARETTIAQLARGATIDAGGEPALQAEIAAARADLLSMGPREAFELNGATIAADPTRGGLLTPREIARRGEALNDLAAERTAVGAFERAGRPPQMIQAVEADESLRPELRQRLAGVLRAAARDAGDREARAQDSADAAAPGRFAAERDGNFTTGFELLASGNLSEDWLRATRGGLDPRDHRVLRTALSGRDGRDDQETLARLRDLAEDGDVSATRAAAFRAHRAGALSAASYRAVIAEAAEAIEPNNPMIGARDVVRGFTAPSRFDGELGRVAREETRRAFDDLSQWRRANPNAPIENQARLFGQAAAQRIQDRARLHLPAPRFGAPPADLESIDALNDEVLIRVSRGEISRAAGFAELRNLAQWRATLGLVTQ